jgi:hypothetical protein
MYRLLRRQTGEEMIAGTEPVVPQVSESRSLLAFYAERIAKALGSVAEALPRDAFMHDENAICTPRYEKGRRHHRHECKQ